MVSFEDKAARHAKFVLGRTSYQGGKMEATAHIMASYHLCSVSRAPHPAIGTGIARLMKTLMINEARDTSRHSLLPAPRISVLTQ